MRCTMHKTTAGLILFVLITLVITQNFWIDMIQTTPPHLAQPMELEILQDERDLFVNESSPMEHNANEVLPLPDEANDQISKQNISKFSPMEHNANEVLPLPNEANDQTSKQNISKSSPKEDNVLPIPDIERDQKQPSTTQRIPNLKADGLATDKKCTPKDHIFFLKVHKCGSSTVQNILMRRGIENELTFVLPEKSNYLGKNETFNPEIHIGASVKLPSMKYDIFTHHSRYNATSVKRIMPEDTVRVAILRESSSQFESQFEYYDLSKRLYGGFNLHQLLRPSNNSKITFQKIYPKLRRYLNHIGSNQMSYDFGMDPRDFDNRTAIKELISMVERDFDLIMISEYMEVSLVLLADIMCWPLEEVTFLRLNSRKNRTELTKKEQDQLRELNNVDTLIYRHFKSVFRKRVESYGTEKMEKQLLKLITMNQRIQRECPISKRKYDPFGFCKYFTMPELKFTDLIRDQQKNKIRVLSNFTHLIHSN